jgi:hypothetical protein
LSARRTSLVIDALLKRGIADCWANEAEAAVLSGMHVKTFRQKRADLEARGFPKIDPANGKRFIPAILDFWQRRAQPDDRTVPQDEPANEQAKEKWDA